MSKKFIITEEERNQIKSLYNINEGAGDIIPLLIKSIFMPTDDEESTDDQGSEESNSSIDLKNVSEKGQELLNNKLFKDRLSEISNKIGVDENSIIKLMKHESNLDPSIKNSIGCVGLIQFCPDNRGGSSKTISGKKYDLEKLRNNLGLQMDAIEEFWVEGKKRGKINSSKDLFIYNFFPVAAGKPDNFVLQTSKIPAQQVANKNPIFNRTLGRARNTPLTVGDLKNFYKQTGMA
jgi:hypothetical protein